MEPLTASRTALCAALMRALHARADPLPIVIDPWGDRLVPASMVDALRRKALSGMDDGERAAAQAAPASIVDAWLRAHAGYANVINRSRYAEDALHAAVGRGVRQYVLIGAGFDSYALRAPDEARHLEIFEIDHPATQSLKRRRLAECGVPPPDSLHFIAADLAQESLGEALSRSAFNAAKPAFFTWLGVTMYLAREANLASLRAISRCAAPGSELVFTYIDQRAFAAGPARSADAFARLRQSVASIGEAFLSGFDPAALAQDLADAGFELVEDLADPQLLERHDPLGMNRLQPSERSRIARARVAEGP